MPGEELAALNADSKVQIQFVRSKVLGHPKSQEGVKLHFLSVNLPDYVRKPPALSAEPVDHPMRKNLVEAVEMTSEAREEMLLG